MISELLAFDSCALTNQGNVRDHNEDACMDAGHRGLWVVADGMGGHEQGDYASQLITSRLEQLPQFDRPSEFVDAFEDCVLGINQQLFEMSAAAAQPTVIGSTVVALLAFAEFGLVSWAGDSRAYRLREHTLSQVSRDHSEVQSLVDQGLVRAEDAESHPQANVITRAVGGQEHLYLDFQLFRLQAGERYLLCSDGLFKDLTEDEIRALLEQGSAQSAASSLIDLALSRTCSDNVTVLVIDVLDAGESTVVADTATEVHSSAGDTVPTDNDGPEPTDEELEDNLDTQPKPLDRNASRSASTSEDPGTN